MTDLATIRRQFQDPAGAYDLDARLRRVIRLGVELGVAEAVEAVGQTWGVIDPQTGNRHDDAPRACAPLWVEKVMAGLR